MALKTVFNFCLILNIFCCASAQNNADSIYHVLFKDNNSFKAEKIENRDGKLFFGITTEEKDFFPKKYLFVYDKNKKKEELPVNEVKEISFSDINKVYWKYKNSKQKLKLYLYRYHEETHCYYKYPVTIEFPPPPPPPDTSRGHGIEIIDN